ncbi:MAG TPA: hypothetical protein VLD35_19805, partial [Caldimonas sp.]|nr:hypothetical protein [Caldimonas sp.]
MTRISIKRALASIASAIVALFSTSAPAISEFGDDGDTGGLPNKVYDAVAWQGITLPKVNVICSPYCRIDAGASGAYTIVLAGGLGYFQR